MTGIILASHGGLAEGVKQSAGMVFGPQEDLVAVTLLPEDGPDSFRGKLEAAVETLSNKEEVVFLVDLLGGTPFNQASAILDAHKDKWAIVTGLSLPMLTELKCNQDFVWLKSVDSMALQEALRNLDRAFQNFFKKQSGYPKFKSKHSHNQSYRTRNQSGGIHIVDGNIKLPRIGIVKTKLSRAFEGRILNGFL